MELVLKRIASKIPEFCASYWLNARIDRAFYLIENDRLREIGKAVVKK